MTGEQKTPGPCKKSQKKRLFMIISTTNQKLTQTLAVFVEYTHITRKNRQKIPSSPSLELSATCHQASCSALKSLETTHSSIACSHFGNNRQLSIQKSTKISLQKINGMYVLFSQPCRAEAFNTFSLITERKENIATSKHK